MIAPAPSDPQAIPPAPPELAPSSRVELPPQSANPLERLRQRQAQLRQILAGATDRQQLLAIATGHLRTSLNGSRALIYQFETAEQGKVLAESIERGWPPSGQTHLPAIFLGYERREDYMCQGTITVADRAAPTVTPDQRQLLEKYQVRSSLATPLYGGGAEATAEQSWGLLVIQQCDRARVWSTTEQLELEQMALLLALALGQQARQLEAQAQQRRDRATAKLSERIRQGLDIKTIFQTATQELRQLLRADRVLLYRFNADWSGKYVAESVGGGWVSLMQTPPDAALRQANSRACSLQAMAGPAPTPVESPDPAPAVVSDPPVPHSPAPDTHLQQTQGGSFRPGDRTRIVADVRAANFPACYGALLEQIQARAYLIVGIYQGEQLWGLLAVYQCSGSRNWSALDVQLTERIAEQLGLALLQALLQRQRRQQGERLTQALERERASALISHHLQESPDLESLFGRVTSEVRQLLAVDRVAIYRFSPDWTGRFVAESVGGDWRSLLRDQNRDQQILQGAKVNIDTEGCTIQALQPQTLTPQDTWLRDTQGGGYVRGEAIRVCEDIEQAGFPDCYLELLKQFQARAYVTVPLFLRDQLWGLMPCYQCAAPRAWQPEEIQLLIHLGSQVSIALRRIVEIAQLREQSQDFAVVAEQEKQTRETLQQQALALHAEIAQLREQSQDFAVMAEQEKQTRETLQQQALALHAEIVQLREQSQDFAVVAEQEKQTRETLQQQALALHAAVRPVLDGNLGVRAPVTADELGPIADLYNQTLQRLARVVGQVQQATEARVAKHEEHDAQLRQLAQRAQQQSQAMGDALAQVQGIATAAQAVGTDAGAIAQLVQQLTPTLATGDAIINRTRASLTTLGEAVAAASQQLQASVEVAQLLNRGVSQMRERATQAQVLSLNAAIEAARAGEAGKGFTVVAQELRALAQQSAATSGEMADQLAALRQQTQAVLQAMAGAIAPVSTGSQQVAATQENLRAIATTTAALGDHLNTMNQATASQLAQTQALTQSLQAATERANHNATESLQLSQQVQATTALAEQLQAVVKPFTVN
ncbi:MAG: GAF domain-containing protein [Cyanobacteria bacterium P01_G01_bin.54]